MRHLKLFESYLSGKSCFRIDHSEFEDLCSNNVVEPDTSGKTNFREKEREYSVSLKKLHQVFERECDNLFGSDKRHRSSEHFDSSYGNFRSVEIEYWSLVDLPGFGFLLGRKPFNIRCDVWEIRDSWFLGYFTYWDINGSGHFYFKCDQIEGLGKLSMELKSEIYGWIEYLEYDED